MEMKYVREPGYVYDLFSPFVLYFNKEAFFEAEIIKNNEAAERKYYEGILDYFGPFSDELYPFFCMKDNARTFVSQYYFYAYEAEMFTTFSLQTVMEALSNTDQVKDNLLRFYFSALDEAEIKNCLHSLEAVSTKIMFSDYSDRLKCGLTRFFLNPAAAVQKLNYALMSAEVKLAQYYEKNYQKILDVQGSISYQELKDSLSSSRNYHFDFDKYTQAHYSVCLIINKCVHIIYTPNSTLFLLGYDFSSFFKYLLEKSDTIKLDILGTALSEPNRVEIFELMYQRGEITIKDIEQTMKISGTNAYYHLMLMLKSNIVQTRSQGRTVCYSINKNQIDRICKFFSKYGNNPLEVK